ncbi:hypothetical protein CJU89_1170 [Yarrowia sp. B02]|nr:hypothetical protein CJU89_1170 [Yarrowia sp. B02]
MIASDMKEADENEVKLAMPKSALEAAVKYLYGQELVLDFDDAARLIVSAQMYTLDELLLIAVEKITTTKMDAPQAVFLWQKCFESNNMDLRKYAAKKLHELLPNVTDVMEKIEGLEKVELVHMFQGVCAVVASSRE